MLGLDGARDKDLKASLVYFVCISVVFVYGSIKTQHVVLNE